MTPHSSTLAWKLPWTEEPGRLQSRGSGQLDTTERLHFHFSLFCIGEGNGNPLQCSCLENPRDGGAWWAAVCGVAQSRTQLKQLAAAAKIRPRQKSSILFLWKSEINKNLNLIFQCIFKNINDIQYSNGFSKMRHNSLFLTMTLQRFFND